MGYPPVVFDCDGVLVDSEELGWAALETVLRRHGQSVDSDDKRTLAGRTYGEDYAHFAAKGPLPPSEEFLPELTDVMTALFEARLEAFEDAVDTLEVLAERGIPLAVASNSPKSRMEAALSATGLARFFSVAISADDVPAGKPAPDIYLAAASGLGQDPGRCVAVEDSPVGVTAAVSAGMRVVAVLRGEHSAEALAGAHVVVPRLTPAVLRTG